MAQFFKKTQTLLLLFLTASFISCSFIGGLKGKSLSATEKLDEDAFERCICIYMCGSTLEGGKGYASKNIAEMLDADIPDDTCVIIQTGGSKVWRDFEISSSELSRFIVDDGELKLIETLPSASMGEPSTLQDFLTFCATRCNAKKMSLVFWDHGTGSNGGVCYDSNYNFDYLSLPELDQALAGFASLGKRLDFVGFDVCLMANYETAAIMSKYADNMIASEEKEPGGGWDYVSLVSEYGNEDFYNSVLESYAQKCQNSKKDYYTLSHIDLTRFGELQAAFSAFCSGELMTNAKRRLQYVDQYAEDSIGFGANSKSEGFSNMIDLAMFARNNGNTAVSQAINNITTCVTGQYRQGAEGISFYYPVATDDEVAAYLQISPSEEYRNFLNIYYQNHSKDENLIEFTDLGTVAENGELHFAITEASLPYIKQVDFVLFQYQVHQEESGEKRVYSMLLGLEDDLVEEAGGGFTTSFGGYWVKWNDNFVPSFDTDHIDAVTTYSIPATCNDEVGVVKFSYDDSNRSFHLLGFIPMDASGLQGRLISINPGDKITILQNGFDRNLKLYTYEVDSFTFDDSIGFSVGKLPEGYYQIYGIITDLYGNEYCTKAMDSKFADGKLTFVQMSDEPAEQNR